MSRRIISSYFGEGVEISANWATTYFAVFMGDHRVSLVAQMIKYLWGDPGSIPGSGRGPGEGNGHSLQHSSLENSMHRGAWQATVHGVTGEVDTAERLMISLHLKLLWHLWVCHLACWGVTVSVYWGSSSRGSGLVSRFGPVWFQFESCPRAVSFFQRLCPTGFPPISVWQSCWPGADAWAVLVGRANTC